MVVTPAALTPGSSRVRSSSRSLEAAQAGAAVAAADVVVHLRAAPVRVEFYDPRPSWPSTFVRRALESDARFHVEWMTFSARVIAAR